MKEVYLIYIAVGAALVPVLDRFLPILRQSYSVWLVPLIVLGTFLLLFILQFILVFSLIFLTDTKKPIKGDQPFFRFLVKMCLPPLLYLAGVRINCGGLEKLPEDNAVLLVCNHQDNLDPVIMLNLIKTLKLSFIGKKDIYTDMPFAAKAMHRLGSLPIDRENDREAVKTIIKAIGVLKENNRSVMVFPEGYTSKTCELLPFRNGCFKMALKTNVPIAVCVINGTRQITKNILRKKTRIDFKVIDLIYPEQYEGMNTSELGDIIHEKMKTALMEIRGEKA